jgi:hypothetical protein
MAVTVTHWTPVLRSLLEETRGVLSRVVFLLEHAREQGVSFTCYHINSTTGMPVVQCQIPY